MEDRTTNDVAGEGARRGGMGCDKGSSPRMGQADATPWHRQLATLAHRHRRLLVVAACLLVFVALLEDVLTGELMRLDALAYRLVVVLNQALKFVVQRPRPDGFRLAEVGGYSFPSGHSMAAMAFFGLLVWIVWHYERDRRMRWGLAAAFSLVIVMVGLSRVYLGVHYASDVVAGFCVSLIWLAVYTRLAVPLFLGPGRGEDAEGSGDADAPSSHR